VRVSTINRVDYTANPTCLDARPDVGGRTVTVGEIGTPVTDVVVGAGCSINQLIRDDLTWRSHGQFVAHVNRVTEHLTDIGAITAEEAQIIIDAAARSGVGR
jgi:hypothetical protein